MKKPASIMGVEITAELAAAVVKNYVLPMFDTDGKLFLKRKQ